MPGPSEGRVEIFFAGEWGTICDDYWDLIDGGVACRQLGYRRASRVFLGAYYGEGRGRIWLDSLQCRGPALTLCQSLGFGLHNCGHHEDAAVICEGPATD